LTCQAAAPAGRYTAPASGVVHDTKTGLDWQQGTSATKYIYADALSYCSANSAGLPGTGWRLPSTKELLTLVDDRAPVAPAIDTAAFPATQQSEYWSATTYTPSPRTPSAWTVSFSDGSMDSSAMTSTYYVRCVR
jgi:hypothetical protein